MSAGQWPFARHRQLGRCSGPGCPGSPVFRLADLIRSHDVAAGEDLGGGGNTTPTFGVLINGGHVQTITTAMRGDDAHTQPQEESSPSRCSCEAEVGSPGDEYCKTCFEAELSEALA